MDTALPQKFPFILDRNLAKANCTENRVCTSCDIVVLGYSNYLIFAHSTGVQTVATFYKLTKISNIFGKRESNSCVFQRIFSYLGTTFDFLFTFKD